MRILHTSDWHLGRSFHRVGMLEHQARFLDHLVEVVTDESVDVVVVAGDVYDRALPSVDAVRLLDDAVQRLSATGARLLLTSGNHDSPDRLGFASGVLERGGVHLRTRVGDLARPVLLRDDDGPVALYGLPYLEPALVAPVLGCGLSHEQVLAAAMTQVHADLATHSPGTRSVVAAHAFVVGGQPSDSERDIRVGGVGSVPASVFAGVSYTALGHLHGRQRLSEQVRYSGSPLAYSFSEARHHKGSWLVDLGPQGVRSCTPVDAPVPRRLAVLRGDLADLLTDPRHEPAQRAWCQVTLTDTARPRAAMDQVRGRFPHTLVLTYEPQGGTQEARTYLQRVRGRDVLDVCCDFVEHVRGGQPTTAPERTLLAEALDGSRELAAGDGRASPSGVTAGPLAARSAGSGAA